MLVGSLSIRTFQGDAVVKSAKARDSRRPRLFDLLSLLWHVLKSFVKFFSSYYDASLISDEDYI